MALFTDLPPADIELLHAYDSSILDVAQTEGINLDPKLMLSLLELVDKILDFLIQQGTPTVSLNRRNVGLSDVVTTPSLRRWHALSTLESIYRDAYGGQSNDRYLERVKQYAALADRAATEYFRMGVGIVQRPVSIGGTPSAPATDGLVYYACVSNLDLTGAEGVHGEVVTLNLSTGAEVSMPACHDYPFWNLYLGADRGSLALQNSSPIAAGSSWNFTGSLSTGLAPGEGQKPDYFVVLNQTRVRG